MSDWGKKGWALALMDFNVAEVPVEAKITTACMCVDFSMCLCRVNNAAWLCDCWFSLLLFIKIVLSFFFDLRVKHKDSQQQMYKQRYKLQVKRKGCHWQFNSRDARPCCFVWMLNSFALLSSRPFPFSLSSFFPGLFPLFTLIFFTPFFELSSPSASASFSKPQ